MPGVLFQAGRTPDVVTVPARTVLAFEGRGAPETAAFQAALQALYGVGYTLKFSRKKAGAGDFRIGPLEGRWWANAEGKAFLRAPRERWCWRLRLAVPDDVSPAELEQVIAAVTTKKGGKLEGKDEPRQVALERVPEQRLGRALHVGPYATEEETFARIGETLALAGARPAFSHLEIYLSDPRRAAPERLKTVLLREIAPGAR